MRQLAAAIALLPGLATHAANAQPLPPNGTAPYPGVMTLSVDTTDLDHKIFRSVQTIPVRPGALVLLLYHPRWLPGGSEFRTAAETRNKVTDFMYSLGIEVGTGLDEGKLGAVAWGSPAFVAGLTPAATLLAVNGRSYKPEGLKDAITAAKASGEPIELLVKTGDLYRALAVTYRGGLRYPTLERIEGTPDRLSELFAPR